MSFRIEGNSTAPIFNQFYFPTGIPLPMTIVTWVKHGNVSGSSISDAIYYAGVTTSNPLVGSNNIGAGNGKFNGVSIFGSIGRLNGPSSAYGTQQPFNSGYMADWKQIAVTVYPDGTPSGLPSVRVHDVVGSLVDEVLASNQNTVSSAERASFNNVYINGNTFFDGYYINPTKMGSLAFFDGELTTAELSEIAAEKNITDAKYTTGGRSLPFYWEFFDDWGSSFVPNQGTELFGMTLPADYIYDEDNPLTPIKLESTQRTGFGNILQIESSIAGTIYATRQTKDSTPPADAAAVISATVGGDVLEVINGAIGTSTLTDFEFTTASSFTEYDYYYALDDGGTTQVLGGEDVTIETCGFIENDEPLADIDGVALANLTNVRVGWFDSTNPATFNVVNSKQLDLDAGGFLKLSLPNSSLAQGLEGTLVLYCNSDGTERTQSIIFEVK